MVCEAALWITGLQSPSTDSRWSLEASNAIVLVFVSRGV